MPIQKYKPRSFDQIIGDLRSHKFDVREAPGVANQLLVEKNRVAAHLTRGPKGEPLLVAQPGVLIGGEISRLLDRGFQKFLKTSKQELPATADALRAVHDFTEELKHILGDPSLYNQSLGTVSNRYLYDRVKGRDLPESQRPVPAWERPTDTE